MHALKLFSYIHLLGSSNQPRLKVNHAAANHMCGCSGGGGAPTLRSNRGNDLNGGEAESAANFFQDAVMSQRRCVHLIARYPSFRSTSLTRNTQPPGITVQGYLGYKVTSARGSIGRRFLILRKPRAKPVGLRFLY